MTRHTYVIEYAADYDPPNIGAGMKMLGGDLVAVQFSDALAELSELIELAGPELSAKAWQRAQGGQG